MGLGLNMDKGDWRFENGISCLNIFVQNSFAIVHTFLLSSTGVNQ